MSTGRPGMSRSALGAGLALGTVAPGLSMSVWAYGGTVPGPELRVQTGDLVRVRFENRLPVPSSIHWHGVPVPNGQDGVTGVTQDAIPSGGSANQIDRGLYGALVVEPRAAQAGILDRALIYDEWPLGSPQPSAPPGDAVDVTRYGVYSVDGRTGSAIQPIRFQPGQTVRLRLVNAGYLTHYVHPHVSYRITGLDGSELTGGPETEHALPLGAGQRVTIEFTAPAEPVWITAHDPSPPAREIGVVALPEGTVTPTHDSWADGTAPTRRFNLDLNEVTGMPSSRDGMPGMPAMQGMDVRYTINGAQFPRTPALTVARGDRVQITLVNKGRMEHPMHLHGQSFRLLARDGRPLPGALVLDTLLTEPGSSYAIDFVADNPGWWAIHCHELHHAAAGMMALLRYDGSPRLAQTGSSVGDESG